MDFQTTNEIGMSGKLNANIETTLTRVTEVLKAEGFGVLTQIDVKVTLKKKLDKEVTEEARVQLWRVAAALKNDP